MTHQLSGSIPAGRPAVDTFVSAALPPVRLASVPDHTPRCPRTSVRPRPVHRGFPDSADRPRTRHPLGTPCRIARRNDSQALPSLWPVTFLEASEPFLREVVGSRQSPDLDSSETFF